MKCNELTSVYLNLLDLFTFTCIYMDTSKKQLDQQTRELIVRKYNNGKCIAEISRELDLNCNTVASVIRLFKTTGRIQALKIRLPKPKKIDGEACEMIRVMLSDDASTTLKSMQHKLKEELDLSVSIGTIHNTLDELHYSFKKISLIPEARNKESIMQIREQYCSDYILVDENKTIFVDEFGINCSMRLSHGRSLVGTTPRKTIRTLRSKNISVCAAVSINKVVAFEIKETAYKSDAFKDFLVRLVAKLREDAFGNGIIIIDNASIHKSAEQKRFLQENGYELRFLPAYSPQLNPIEEVFSKWKHLVKAQNPSTVENLKVAIESASNLINPSDCRNFYSHMKKFILKGIR